MSSRRVPSDRPVTVLGRGLRTAVAAGLMVLAASGCTLLGKDDWSCQDAATPGFEKLQGLVKTWSKTDAVSVELVGDSCGQKDGFRFLEVPDAPQPLIDHLNSICTPVDEGRHRCETEGLHFATLEVPGQHEGAPSVLGLVMLES